MKTVNGVDTPSKARSLDYEQSPRREDFALELSKVSDSQHEGHHAPHVSDLWHGHEPAHPMAPSQTAVTTASTSPASTLVTSTAMKAVPPEYPLPSQTTTFQNEAGFGPVQVIPVTAAKSWEMTPAMLAGATAVSTAVAAEALPITPGVEKPGALPTSRMTPATQTAMLGLPPSVSIVADPKSPYEMADTSPDLAQAAPPVKTQEGDSQSWLSTQRQLNVLVAPTGVTEDLLGSRVFGVHLLASTYLSELAAREDGGITDSMPIALVPTDAHTPAITQPITMDVTPNLSEAVADQASRGEANIILGVIMNEEMVSATDNAHPTRAPAMATFAAATLVWPESLLRLTKDSDGSTVVWLRDYRVAGEEASRLVGALVQGGHAQGARLGRIVLNGREVWTSPNNR